MNIVNCNAHGNKVVYASVWMRVQNNNIRQAYVDGDFDVMIYRIDEKDKVWDIELKPCHLYKDRLYKILESYNKNLSTIDYSFKQYEVD